MFRVGILGTENSHATKFASIFNTPDAAGNFVYPDFKVTALYAMEKEPSEKIKNDIDPSITIVNSIEEMISLVDCIMVTARHGKYHAEMALPFIEKGMPAFIDKPFTIDIAEGRKILETARKNNVPLCGGSGIFLPSAISVAVPAVNLLPKFWTTTIPYKQVHTAFLPLVLSTSPVTWKAITAAFISTVCTR